MPTITLTRDQRAPVLARRALEDVAAGLDPALLGDARLLLNELVTNSVRHGAGQQVRVIIDRPEPRSLRCEVVDEGDGFEPVPRPKNSTKAGGWGLYLVEKLAARWGVSTGSTHVWFELRGG
jgi:two-component sensor histidine kinase